jgi:ketol-acid reductoisomerase
VLIGQRANSQRFDQAIADGFAPFDLPEAARQSDLIILALPDERMPAIFESQIRPVLRSGQAVGFLHGFVIHYELLRPPQDVDVILVAPKGQGDGVRSAFVAGGGVMALVAVHQDATRRAREMAGAWAAGIGAARAAIFETTFRDETETDLFGEQAVLCGGVSELVRAGFDTLVEAGYPPELAYIECCHELKLIVDLVHRGGLSFMYERISSAARLGGLTRGPRVINAAAQNAMREILAEIRSGRFARELAADSAVQNASAHALTARLNATLLEQVGGQIRGSAS